jgi:spore germination cell wall hydrolase CwlJ-like protein
MSLIKYDMNAKQLINEVFATPPPPPPAEHQLFQQDELHQKGTEAILATTITLEAANQGKAGREAVANVIMNRAKHQAGNIWAVCTKTTKKGAHEFSCFNRRTPGEAYDIASKDPKFSSVWEDSRRIARAALAATFYHTKNSTFHGAWADKLVKTVEIGSHVFYK